MVIYFRQEIVYCLYQDNNLTAIFLRTKSSDKNKKISITHNYHHSVGGVYSMLIVSPSLQETKQNMECPGYAIKLHLMVRPQFKKSEECGVSFH